MPGNLHRRLRHAEIVVDDAVQQRPELGLQRRELQADHAAAEHARVLRPTSFAARTIPAESGG